MTAASGTAATGTDIGSIEALKRIKATETEWDAKLAAARENAEAALRRLAEESESAVRAAREEAEARHAEAVRLARAAADEEAASIVAQGRTAADAAAKPRGQGPVDRAEEVLAIVLGSFRAD